LESFISQATPEKWQHLFLLAAKGKPLATGRKNILIDCLGSGLAEAVAIPLKGRHFKQI